MNLVAQVFIICLWAVALVILAVIKRARQLNKPEFRFDPYDIWIKITACAGLLILASVLISSVGDINPEQPSAEYTIMLVTLVAGICIGVDAIIESVMYHDNKKMKKLAVAKEV